jgi:hypothetical protein
MKPLALALALLASMPAEAAACHRYSHWYYPWRQSCRVHQVSSEFIRRPAVGREKAVIQLPPEPEIPLPSLARAEVDGGEADEASRRALLLRVAVGVPDAY